MRRPQQRGICLLTTAAIIGVLLVVLSGCAGWLPTKDVSPLLVEQAECQRAFDRSEACTTADAGKAPPLLRRADLLYFEYMIEAKYCAELNEAIDRYREQEKCQ